jgi:hypothetical protein
MFDVFYRTTQKQQGTVHDLKYKNLSKILNFKIWQSCWFIAALCSLEDTHPWFVIWVGERGLTVMSKNDILQGVWKVWMKPYVAWSLNVAAMLKRGVLDVYIRSIPDMWSFKNNPEHWRVHFIGRIVVKNLCHTCLFSCIILKRGNHNIPLVCWSFEIIIDFYILF